MLTSAKIWKSATFVRPSRFKSLAVTIITTKRVQIAFFSNCPVLYYSHPPKLPSVVPRPTTQVEKDFPVHVTLKYGGLFQTSVLTKGKGIFTFKNNLQKN